ncbi:Uncharacterised protein [Chromobacterium violaceum]|uniref:Uncharacterized protein n=1 Tax=Chromobacterium violaceum TaxID=536 RepID=A0A3S4ICL3_CHRVL|nr:Uncharacterised protein [Chromobacterium violaceum]
MQQLSHQLLAATGLPGDDDGDIHARQTADFLTQTPHAVMLANQFFLLLRDLLLLQMPPQHGLAMQPPQRDRQPGALDRQTMVVIAAVIDEAAHGCVLQLLAFGQQHPLQIKLAAKLLQRLRLAQQLVVQQEQARAEWTSLLEFGLLHIVDVNDLPVLLMQIVQHGKQCIRP